MSKNKNKEVEVSAQAEEQETQAEVSLAVVDEVQKVGEDAEAKNDAVVDPDAGEKFDLEKPVSRDLATLSALRKQILVDLAPARKDEDGHALAKDLEAKLDQIDREIEPLKAEILRKQEKLKAKIEIGSAPAPELPKKVVPPSANVISDSQIGSMFKLQLKAPTSVAYDMVKICGILEEAARDIYFAHDARKPVIQETIKILAKLAEEICQELKDDEEKRLAELAKK